MPRVEESQLLLVDTALQVVGALVLAVVLVHLVRSGRWRNPLERVEATGRGPEWVHLVGVLLGFYVLLFALARLVGINPDAAQTAGSHDWHLGHSVEAGLSLTASVVIVFILRRHRSFRADPGRRLGPLGVLQVGLAAGLIILAVCYVQLHAGKIVWRWLEPQTEQPIHRVLEAFERSSWGPWGTAQLLVGAIIITPVAEELFFRGLLLQTVWRYLGQAWLTIVLSGVAFGLVHRQQPQDVLPLVTMGVILGYVRVRYRSLTACILIHALFNGRTMLFAWLNPELVRSGW